jgi:nucleotide-binding universal stress UspA family protein
MAGTIVVGVDGSHESKQALRWALGEARVRGARIVALRAWVYPALAAGGLIPVTADLVEQLSANEQKELAATVEEVAGESDVEVEQVVVEDAPARALVAASEDADLLVVGTRGHGGFSGLVLGSVSQQCAHHASCPVVIVPPRAEG